MNKKLFGLLFFGVAASLGMSQPSKLRIMRRHTQSSRRVGTGASIQDQKSAREIREGKFIFYRDALHTAFLRLKEEVDPQEQVFYFKEVCGLYELAIALYPEIEASRWIESPAAAQAEALRAFNKKLLQGAFEEKKA